MARCKNCGRPVQYYQEFCCRDCQDEYFAPDEPEPIEKEENDE
ncbi:hypothetical protein [Sporomusa sphaeroides]|nr:hypothetical protein [Sporomusa sphaeroides]